MIILVKPYKFSDGRNLFHDVLVQSGAHVVAKLRHIPDEHPVGLEELTRGVNVPWGILLDALACPVEAPVSAVPSLFAVFPYTDVFQGPYRPRSFPFSMSVKVEEEEATGGEKKHKPEEFTVARLGNRHFIFINQTLQ